MSEADSHNYQVCKLEHGPCPNGCDAPMLFVHACSVCNADLPLVEPAIATWSYQELVGYIGLEAVYRMQSLAALQLGVKIPGRTVWAITPAPCFMSPANFIRALQAGCEFAAPPQMPAGRGLGSLIHRG